MRTRNFEMRLLKINVKVTSPTVPLILSRTNLHHRKSGKV